MPDDDRRDGISLLEELAEPLWQLGDPYPEGWIPVPDRWLALRNPRRGDIDTIVESIEENGWFGQLTVQLFSERQQGPRIIRGNHRYKAGVRCGMSLFPVEVLDVDDLAGDRVLIIDNRSSDKARNLDDEMVEVLHELRDANMLPGSGFSSLELAALEASLLEPPEPPPAPPTPDGVKFNFGPISFHADHELFERWYANVTGEVGTATEDIIAEIRSRLSL